MFMNKQLHIILFIYFVFSFTFAHAQKTLIPYPKNIKVNSGNITLTESFKIHTTTADNEAEYLQKSIQDIAGLDVPITDKEKPWYIFWEKEKKILLEIKKDKKWENEEAYQLEISNDHIHIQSGSAHGVFNGIITLIQLLKEHKDDLKIPKLTIKDAPKFTYRGMHLDVARHFFDVKEVKRYLDYLAAYKINTFHWHLTDDQGWRIEIKKYPKLTEVGAYRKKLPFDGNEHTYQDSLYGGYYTQEEAKEVVEYAKKLHIEVVPEIEMPGHATAALAAYPNLACTEGPFEVETTWGVFEDIYCPKEETFTFLENVIDEIVEIFPGKYIHIGGDEAPKKRWEECDYCQQLIKQQGLKDELELQSYFVKRMEKYINGKGRDIIGWDEILEGGLAPNATVMSWTGTDGAIKAAKNGNDAIMTPVSHMYFDYYQGNPASEPLAFSAELRLEKVYSFNPIPEELNKNEEKHILGLQANLWTEYIPNFQHVEYMIFPRIMAMSEVAWGTSNPDKYDEFEKRVIQNFKILDEKEINYSAAINEVSGEIKKENNALVYALSNKFGNEGIYYTTDGSTPTIDAQKYTAPIRLDKTMSIQAAYFENDKLQSNVLKQEFKISKSTGKNISLENTLEGPYSEGGPDALVDGIFGNKNYFAKNWIGISQKDLIPTIDFGEQISFSKIQTTVLEQKGSWIHYPEGIGVYVSHDNEAFTLIHNVPREKIIETGGNIEIQVPHQNARYLKLIYKSIGEIPEGSPGAGHGAWMFVDEIAVE